MLCLCLWTGGPVSRKGRAGPPVFSPLLLLCRDLVSRLGRPHGVCTASGPCPAASDVARVKGWCLDEEDPSLGAALSSATSIMSAEGTPLRATAGEAPGACAPCSGWAGEVGARAGGA